MVGAGPLVRFSDFSPEGTGDVLGSEGLRVGRTLLGAVSSDGWTVGTRLTGALRRGTCQPCRKSS